MGENTGLGLAEPNKVKKTQNETFDRRLPYNMFFF
jgi:hypothetical protein